MTEKEKMLQGQLYDANHNPELIEERQKAKESCFTYNQTIPTNMEKRTEILKNLLGSTKNNFLIEPSFQCDYGYNIHIGENFYANHNLVILDAAEVTFGDNVLIGPNCGFYTAGHPTSDVEQRRAGLEYAKPIHIGNDVWIGGNVAVLPGVTIGDNSVIGAGSVVNKDIPAGVIAVGNPCKVVKKI